MSTQSILPLRSNTFRFDYTNGDYLGQLPDSSPIFSLLNIKDLLTCSLVCKKWNEESLQPKIWKQIACTLELEESDNNPKQKVKDFVQTLWNSNGSLNQTLKIEKSAVEIDISYLSIMRQSNRLQDNPSQNHEAANERELIQNLKQITDNKKKRHTKAKTDFHHLLLLQTMGFVSLEDLNQKAEQLTQKYDDPAFLSLLTQEGKSEKSEMEEEQASDELTPTEKIKEIEYIVTDRLAGKSYSSTLVKTRNQTPFIGSRV